MFLCSPPSSSIIRQIPFSFLPFASEHMVRISYHVPGQISISLIITILIHFSDVYKTQKTIFYDFCLTLPFYYSIIFFGQPIRKALRKCRNWQTSKTKDLVTIAVVWVQVPSSALKDLKLWLGSFFAAGGRNPRFISPLPMQH